MLLEEFSTFSLPGIRPGYIKPLPMQHALRLNRSSRNTLLRFLDGYTPEQLNAIPPGFNNNIIWNIAHIIVTQQGLVYSLSGLPPMVPKEMIDKYKKGTRPEGVVGAEEIAEIRSLLFSTLDQTEKDYAEGKFRMYQEFEISSVGHVLKNVDDALLFNDFHEAMHLGILLMMRKFI